MAGGARINVASQVKDGIITSDKMATGALGNLMQAALLSSADKTEITGVTPSMLGMGGSLAYTPDRACDLLILGPATLRCDTTAKTVTAELYFSDDGSAPANAAAVPGTADAASVAYTFKALTGNLQEQAMIVAYITAVVADVPLWFDYAVNTDDAGAKGNVLGAKLIIVQV